MERKPKVPILAFIQTDMASSLESTRDCTPVSANKNIPLLCTVCPEAPRFSDVSHLLTHIASKGHLHHETQTKLKSHQDIAASVTLQQYESWYKANGIEALLVERMKAKQKKEAARTSRTRDSTPSVASKSRRKTKRGSNKTTVKAEQDDLTQDFPLFPGFFPSENDAEVDEEFASSDMLSLKGQVWPGMGKMDLANDDMKRTRNQRKPNSVIEKMKHTSEGIEPTQVVMTPDFEVERVKGVYDSSSPIPGQEEEVALYLRRERVISTSSTNCSRPRRRLCDPKESGLKHLLKYQSMYLAVRADDLAVEMAKAKSKHLPWKAMVTAYCLLLRIRPHFGTEMMSFGTMTMEFLECMATACSQHRHVRTKETDLVCIPTAVYPTRHSCPLRRRPGMYLLGYFLLEIPFEREYTTTFTTTMAETQTLFRFASPKPPPLLLTIRQYTTIPLGRHLYLVIMLEILEITCFASIRAVFCNPNQNGIKVLDQGNSSMGLETRNTSTSLNQTRFSPKIELFLGRTTR